MADDFTVTGLTHVVAISGWNIALVAGIATGLLRATGLGRRPRSLIVIVAIVAYTVLAGAEASVIRAAVMGGIVLIAREGGRPSGAAAALGLACWGLLLVEPRMIDDIGLQLSLAATAGLLALGGHAEAAIGAWVADVRHAGSARRWACRWRPSCRRCRSSCCTSGGSRSSRRWPTCWWRRSCRWRCSVPPSASWLVRRWACRGPTSCWHHCCWGRGCRWR